MKNFASLTAVSAVLLLLLFLPAHLDAQAVKTFEIPGVPIAISASGEIVGSYTANGRQHGYIRHKDGTITSFDPPDYPCGEHYCRKPRITFPTSVSPSGEIAGYFYMIDVPIDPNNTSGYPYASHGFVRHRDGTFSVWATTYGDYVHAVGINSKSDVVGWENYDMGGPIPAFIRHADGTIETYTDSRFIAFYAINAEGKIVGRSSQMGSFLRDSDGTFTPFSVDGSNDTTPIAINSAGTIVGRYSDDLGAIRGYVRESNGVVTTFYVPDSVDTRPIGMNARGDIVGVYTDSNSVAHGFVRDKWGYISTFDVPNSVSTTPTAINSSGDITGWYSDGTGAFGFILISPK